MSRLNRFTPRAQRPQRSDASPGSAGEGPGHGKGNNFAELQQRCLPSAQRLGRGGENQ
ncbi:MAG TPA: hypothetical protein VHT50_01545 [Mycobacterium sp.]|nr:hypothetical protein [Mycobacterium sp.]